MALKSRITWILLVWAVMFGFPWTAHAVESGPDNPDILVMVNGTPITREQVNQESRLMHAAIALDPRFVGNLDLYDYSVDLLENLIERELLRKEVDDKKIRISARRVEDALQELQSRFENTAAFEKYLSGIDIDMAALKERFTRGLKIQRLLHNEVIRGVRVSDAELHRFYDQYPDDFIRHSQVRARHILVAVTDESRRAMALLKIEALELKLARGADFAVLALENSDGPSKSKGGDLGYFTYDEVDPTFGNVAFSLSVGQVSNIVQTRFGYHLIKVIDRLPPSRIPFKDVRYKIERTIRRNKENQAVRQYVAALKHKATILRYDAVP